MRWGALPPLSPEPSGAGPDGAARGNGRGEDTGEEWPGRASLSLPPRGFCFFNSVAIACRQLQQQGKASKILIMDWVGPGSWFLVPGPFRSESPVERAPSLAAEDLSSCPSSA